nr:hypothetical protein [bacterium]
RVSRPADFLYASRAPVDSLQMLANQVIREITGTRALFNLLTHDRDTLEIYARDTIQTLADDMNLGIDVVQLCLLDMHPPIEVAPAYEDVVSAQEDLETFVEQARGYQRELLPGAEAEAYTATADARAYALNIVQRADGRAQAFAARNAAFRTHEAVNRYRFRLEALEAWLQGRKLWLVDPKASGRPMDLFINPGSAADTTPMMMQPGTGGEGF